MEMVPLYGHEDLTRVWKRARLIDGKMNELMGKSNEVTEPPSMSII